MKTRCDWCIKDPLYMTYHDTEWGNPLHDDNKLFELLILESMQAGLSWITILKKRENFRVAFEQFDPHKMARFTASKIEKLLMNPGIIRSRLKIEAAIKNAKLFLATQNEFTSFDNYIWQFTDGKTLQNKRKNLKSVPATTAKSDRMAKDLKKRGFGFVGSTTCYAYMQAIGMVNDHIQSCFRYKELAE